jgi:hypothetical protein
VDPVGCWWHCNKCTKKNSGDQEEINSSFSTSFHMKEISSMYLNIFDVFQGAKAQQLLFAAVTFLTPTTKQAKMVRTLLINILYTAVEKRLQVKKEITYSLTVRSKGSVSVLIVFNESR